MSKLILTKEPKKTMILGKEPPAGSKIIIQSKNNATVSSPESRKAFNMMMSPRARVPYGKAKITA